MARKRIGALLEERGLITEFQLVAALSHQRKWKGKLGRSLIELGYLDEQKLYEVLAEQLGMTLVDLRSRQLPLEILGKLSRKEAQALKAVPVEIKPNALVVAVAEPDLPDLQAALTKAAGQPVELVLGLESAVEVLNSRIPDKFQVAAVQPIKKAFIRNHRGQIEPLEETPRAEPSPPPTPAPEVAEPQASEDAPIALDDGDSDALGPASAPSGDLPEPTRPLEIPDLELPPPPSPLPPVEPAAASDLPEDLWAMPKPEPPSPAPESSASPVSAERGMDLPPPPSLDLFDLPPPPTPLSSGAEQKAATQVPNLDLAPSEEIPLPEADQPARREAPMPEVPTLDLMPQEPGPRPEPSEAQAGEIALNLKPETRNQKPIEKPSDQLLSSLLDDLSSLTAPRKAKEEKEALEPPPELERIAATPPSPPAAPAPGGAGALGGAGAPSGASALTRDEEPWLEKPHATIAPVAPLDDLVTEDVKAEAVAFQQELHRSRQTQAEPSGLEVASSDLLERRLAKLEEEVRKLRETVEDLVLKIKR